MPTTADNQNTMEFLLDVPVKLTVELGNCEMTMKDLLQVGIGSVVQLDKSSRNQNHRGIDRERAGGG